MALKKIRCLAIGLVLSISLAACAHTAAKQPDPVVVIQTVREAPPSDLITCPPVPRGLPATGEATIPTDWRAAIIGLAAAYADVMGQLERLIVWHGGERCALQDPAPP